MDNMKSTAPYAPNNAASKMAAKKIQHMLKGYRAEVFEYIVIMGVMGATGSEIAEKLDALIYTVKPRCTELSEAGYIRDSGMTRKNNHGNEETVWVACEQWPNEPYVAKKKQVKPSGLKVFDDVLRRNPHLRSTFTSQEIEIIRKDLGAKS